MNKFLLKTALAAFLLSFSVGSQAINHRDLKKYAASLKGKKGAELKKALFDLARKDLKTLGYGSGLRNTWDGFYDTDRIPETNECINRYSHFQFKFGKRGKSIDGMNIEHSFPKSWWGGGKTDAYHDLFNLYPCDQKTNSRKSNYPMGKVEHVTDTYAGEGYTKIGTGNAGSYQNVKLWEPGEKFKGEFSRSYMYMATTYADYHWVKVGPQTMEDGQYPSLRKWAQDLYREWSKADKVDEGEILRNNTVQTRQNNRNLYIDYPYLPEYVWGDSVDVAFDPNTSISTSEGDERYYSVYLKEKAPDVYPPMFQPGTGTYTSPVTIKMESKTQDAKIYYTIDGTQPNATSTLYNGEFTISTTTTIHAIAIQGDKKSRIVTAVYTFNDNTDLYSFGKITEAPKDGKKYLIVVDNNGLQAMKPIEKKPYGYFPAEKVVENNNVITLSNEVLAYTFKSVAGGFKIQQSTGNYLAQEGKYNTITSETVEDLAGIWSITPNADGTYVIKSVETGKELQMDTKYGNFGCYSGLTKNRLYPMLYEKDNNPPAGIENVSVTGHVENNVIYNLQGVQMPKGVKLKSGIYIMNGKKFVVK